MNRISNTLLIIVQKPLGACTEMIHVNLRDGIKKLLHTQSKTQIPRVFNYSVTA